MSYGQKKERDSVRSTKKRGLPVYKVLDLTKQQKALTSVKFEMVSVYTVN